MWHFHNLLKGDSSISPQFCGCQLTSTPSAHRNPLAKKVVQSLRLLFLKASKQEECFQLLKASFAEELRGTLVWNRPKTQNPKLSAMIESVIEAGPQNPKPIGGKSLGLRVWISLGAPNPTG